MKLITTDGTVDNIIYTHDHHGDMVIGSRGIGRIVSFSAVKLTVTVYSTEWSSRIYDMMVVEGHGAMIDDEGNFICHIKRSHDFGELVTWIERNITGYKIERYTRRTLEISQLDDAFENVPNNAIAGISVRYEGDGWLFRILHENTTYRAVFGAGINTKNLANVDEAFFAYMYPKEMEEKLSQYPIFFANNFLSSAHKMIRRWNSLSEINESQWMIDHSFKELRELLCPSLANEPLKSFRLVLTSTPVA